jgi:sulfide:quinone oxidoreductase
VKRIVILGGGTGETLIANRLRRSLDEQAAEIVVVDHDADHVYQPGLLFVAFGLTSMQRIVRPQREQFRSGISFCQAGVDRVDIEADRVHLDDGTALATTPSWSPPAHGCCPRRPKG